ncbi:MAG: hypothetical protein IKZ46_11025, partial [Victivallales bacterium]|nr:hypothetical protein [Victivallales bacterium]
PGSNSPSLKSPNGGAQRRRHPVDSIISNFKDFLGEEPHASHGEPFHLKIMFAHIALLGFQRAGGSFRQYHAVCLSFHPTRQLPYHAFLFFQAIMAVFPIRSFRKKNYRTPPRGDDRLLRIEFLTTKHRL